MTKDILKEQEASNSRKYRSRFNETKFKILQYAYRFEMDNVVTDSIMLSKMSGIDINTVFCVMYNYTVRAVKPYFRRTASTDDKHSCCINYKLTKHGKKMLQKYILAKSRGLTLNLRHPKIDTSIKN